jgi:hypothetical protein
MYTHTNLHTYTYTMQHTVDLGFVAHIHITYINTRTHTLHTVDPGSVGLNGAIAPYGRGRAISCIHTHTTTTTHTHTSTCIYIHQYAHTHITYRGSWLCRLEWGHSAIWARQSDICRHVSVGAWDRGGLHVGGGLYVCMYVCM